MKVNRSDDFINVITNRSRITTKIGIVTLGDLRNDPNDDTRALVSHYQDCSFDYDYCLYGYIVGADQLAAYKKSKTSQNPLEWIKREYQPKTSE